MMVSTSKQQLRSVIARIIGNLSATEKQIQSESVFQRLIQHPKFKAAQNVSIFLSTDNEINTISILRHALEVDKKRCFVPLVRRKKKQQGDDATKTRMIMVELKSMREYDELPVNHYGIKEPINYQENTRADPVECNLDLIIVPGVAFSCDGRRLGHGRGYYDEFLSDWNKRSPSLLYSIGLAFREQMVDDPLAIEGQDVQLDEVLQAAGG